MTSSGPAAGDYLRLSAERFPDRACLVTADGTRFTFEQTNGRVNRLASVLLDRQVRRGDRLAIMATNSVAYAEILFASFKVGATYVPLNNRLAQTEVAALLRSAEPKILFVDRRYLDLCRSLVPDRAVVVIDGPADGCEDYETLLQQGVTGEPDISVDDDDILGLAFTSGTTGRPKGVLQSQQMIKNLTMSITLDYEIQPDEFRYSSSPMFHIGGQSPVFMHAWRGFPTLILPQFDVEQVLHWMQHGGLTGCFLVPTMISSLLAHPDAGKADYGSLRSIIYGAAPMPPSVLREAMRIFGCDFVNAFGAGTETGLQTVLSSADHRRAASGADHLLGSIGKPAYGVDLKLLDEAGAPVPRGRVGEIVTRNGQTMTGYLGMPEATRAALSDGWFRAGDLARMDEEGYLYLAGRRNDMIIRGGENIYPIEIEDVVCQFPTVRQAAVVGRPDEHWGETVTAFVTVAPGETLDAPALLAFCSTRLAKYKVPADVVVLAELPLNASGKVMRRTLRDSLTG